MCHFHMYSPHIEGMCISTMVAFVMLPWSSLCYTYVCRLCSYLILFFLYCSERQPTHPSGQEEQSLLSGPSGSPEPTAVLPGPFREAGPARTEDPQQEEGMVAGSLRRSVGRETVGASSRSFPHTPHRRDRRHADVRAESGRDGPDQEARGGDTGERIRAALAAIRRPALQTAASQVNSAMSPRMVCNIGEYTH